MKYYAFLLLSLCSFAGAAQQASINDYKYALVPAKFDFLKEADTYRLNTYTKMFLQKYGFETYLDSEPLPAEFATYNCNKVYVNVINSSTAFITKLQVEVKDCKNNVLFTSAQGQSREKDYKIAYLQALREAFKSFDGLKYQYNGKNPAEIIVEKKGNAPVVVADIKKDVAVKPIGIVVFPNAKLSAIATTSGFDMVNISDTEIGKKVISLLKTSQKNYFIAEMADRHGVFINIDGQWLFEYYLDGRLISQQMTIANLKPE